MPTANNIQHGGDHYKSKAVEQMKSYKEAFERSEKKAMEKVSLDRGLVVRSPKEVFEAMRILYPEALKIGKPNDEHSHSFNLYSVPGIYESKSLSKSVIIEWLDTTEYPPTPMCPTVGPDVPYGSFSPMQIMPDDNVQPVHKDCEEIRTLRRLNISLQKEVDQLKNDLKQSEEFVGELRKLHHNEDVAKLQDRLARLTKEKCSLYTKSDIYAADIVTLHRRCNEKDLLISRLNSEKDLLISRLNSEAKNLIRRSDGQQLT